MSCTRYNVNQRFSRRKQQAAAERRERNLVPRGRDPFGQRGDRDLWPGPILEVRDSRTSRHSAHAQSQVWQIWLVLVSIYCVYLAIQNQNVVRPGQGSRFPAHDQRDPWGRGWRERVIYTHAYWHVESRKFTSGHRSLPRSVNAKGP